MDIEAELPPGFDDMSDEEKVSVLEDLKQDFDGDTDGDAIKRRMLEELIRIYRE